MPNVNKANEASRNAESEQRAAEAASKADQQNRYAGPVEQNARPYVSSARQRLANATRNTAGARAIGESQRKEFEELRKEAQKEEEEKAKEEANKPSGIQALESSTMEPSDQSEQQQTNRRPVMAAGEDVDEALNRASGQSASQTGSRQKKSRQPVMAAGEDVDEALQRSALPNQNDNSGQSKGKSSNAPQKTSGKSKRAPVMSAGETVDEALNRANQSSQVTTAESPANTNTVVVVQQPPQQSTEREAPDIREFQSRRQIKRAKKAKIRNRSIKSQDKWLREHPGFTPADYKNMVKKDYESFDYGLKSLMGEHYTRITDKEDDGTPVTPMIPGRDFKPNKKKWRLIGSVTKAFQIGTFPVATEYLEKTDKFGSTDDIVEQYNDRWGSVVENSITMLCNICGKNPELEDSKTNAFRFVQWCASMSQDRNGKWFNKEKGDWRLSEDEFQAIIINGIQSAEQSLRMTGYAVPNIMPAFLGSGATTQLRGTDIYPSWVMPIALADFLTGPESVFGDDAKDLIERCREEGVNRTAPMMRANLVDEDIAQRIVIEDIQEAYARMNGERDMARYGIDTTDHYHFSELEDINIQYAKSTNGNLFDADAVNDLHRKKIEKIQKVLSDPKNRASGSALSTGARIVTSGIKTNALFWQVPIMLSMIAEKGVGDVQTLLATRAIMALTNESKSDFAVSQNVLDAMKTNEASEAFQCELLLWDVGGVEGSLMFHESGKELTHENVSAFIQENYIAKPEGKTAQKLAEIQDKLNRFSNKILAGDFAFKKFDSMNFLNAFLASNMALRHVQVERANNGEKDQWSGLAFTGDEISDAFEACNGNVTAFITEMMSTNAGRDALIMMRSNNIANLNPISHMVGDVLRKHSIGEAAITAFLDSFAKYGINFCYTVLPFSRTMTYVAMKKKQRSGNLTASDWVMGGNLSGERTWRIQKDSQPIEEKDPGYVMGLRMNLMFDAMTMGRWAVTAGVMGIIFSILGYDEPDDPEDLYNSSKWKIGGVEFQKAFWTNDLTQLGLPIAHFVACLTSGHDFDTASKLFLDSLYDMYDGNVVLDIVDTIRNWGEDLGEMQRIQADPTYVPEGTRDPSLSLMELGLSAFTKVVPGAPMLYAASKSTLVRGDDALMYSTSYAFDNSDEWSREMGKTTYIQDPEERLRRKYSARNWLYAWYNNFVRNQLSNDPESKTGYQWWQMPVRTKTDPTLLVWVDKFNMDYSNMGGKTRAEYNADKTQMLLDEIAKFDSPEEAAAVGFFIPAQLRRAALNTLMSEMNAMDNDFKARSRAQDFDYYEDWEDEKNRIRDKKNAYWNIVNYWLKNDNITSWPDQYVQLLSDYDITYTHEDGSPAVVWERFLPGSSVVVDWKLKGNHPKSLLPFTTVDTTRPGIGWSAETLPYWWDDGENGTDLDYIKNGIGTQTIKMGRDAGTVLNDVLFGEEYGGRRLHPDQPTIGERSWIPRDMILPDDIMEFGPEDADGGIYGEIGTTGDSNGSTSSFSGTSSGTSGSNSDNGTGSSGADRSGTGGADGALKLTGGSISYDNGSGNLKVNDTSPSGEYDDDTKPWKSYSDTKPWKYSNNKSFYSGGRSYGGKGYSSSYSSSNYYPRIYSNTHGINPDKASGYYSKMPSNAWINSYMRPSFSTKGSRESYRRQDF